MALLRGRRDEPDGGRRFQMHEKMFSIGDDYWIEDESGERAYRVNGKAIRLRDTWVLEDAAGNEVATIREKKLSIRNSITIDLGVVAIHVLADDVTMDQVSRLGGRIAQKFLCCCKGGRSFTGGSGIGVVVFMYFLFPASGAQFL